MGDMTEKPPLLGEAGISLSSGNEVGEGSRDGEEPGFCWPSAAKEYSYDEEAVSGLAKRIEDLKSAPVGDFLEFGEKLFSSASLPGLAFDRYRAGTFDQALVLTAQPKDTVVWFVGDLHGDLLALEAALFHIERERKEGQRDAIVFLGDLIDDNPDSYGVFLRVLSLIAANPSSVCLLSGNHDEALFFDGKTFTSSVDPSDYSEWLKLDIRTLEEKRAGKLFCRFYKDAPRALFFDDGLVAAHGGIPHVDLHDTIRLRADLNRTECLQDFVWTRASPRSPKKIPNRQTKGCQFGYKDFECFCEVAGNVLGHPVIGMVRGHDHVDQRFDLHPSYANRRLLTINTLGHRLSREAGAYTRTPCLAHYVPYRGIEVHRLNLPEGLLQVIYPETPVA